MAATKYLDYEGLKKYDGALKKHVQDITGTNFKVASTDVNIKDYIDSRIYVGTAAEVELALNSGAIDETTFKVITDADAEMTVAITDTEINGLFAAE